MHDERGAEIAACSLWWDGLPAVDGRRPGFIGHFSAATEPAALELLRRACRALADRHCEVAVGPINGTTWHTYRLVTAGGDTPAFAMEPANPPEWPEYFRAAGFGALARYHSFVTESLIVEDPRSWRSEARLRALGFTIRSLDTSKIDQELAAIHAVAVQAFAGAFLYQPIELSPFLESIRPVLPLLVPDLVLIAERSGVVCGFLFAIPDPFSGTSCGAPDTVILKTVAVLPRRDHAGLGGWLSRQLHSRAAALGYRRVIHALLHESNSSLNLHRAPCSLLREYTLFSKTL